MLVNSWCHLVISPIPIWIRIEELSSKNCFVVKDFTITFYLQPAVDVIQDVVACSSYVLPVITDGNYYTEPNGAGTLLHAGDQIHDGGIYYIFNNPKGYRCANQSSFRVTLIDEIIFPTLGCGNYIVPIAPVGQFFTGSGGSGKLLEAGTVLKANQTIYYYAVLNGLVCRDLALDITIVTLPLVDSPTNVITCDSYTLPSLINGNYYTEPDGKGIHLNSGDVITTSQDIYVFSSDGICFNQNKFRVDIVDTSIFTSITSCGSFILPSISFGNYYTQPFGKGNVIPAGTSISSSQNIYYYAETSTFPNCTDNLNYRITIQPKPLVDSISDQFACISYTLPPLVNGNYFTEANGGGILLNSGTVITKTQTIYIFAADVNGCSDEHRFEVVIRPLPPVDSFIDVFTCNTFTLPLLKNGAYYTASGGPHGGGKQLAAGTVIATTQTIYIYNEWPDLLKMYNKA